MARNCLDYNSYQKDETYINIQKIYDFYQNSKSCYSKPILFLHS